MGNIDADQEKNDIARNHYNTALKILRGITRKDSLIEALLARGCWAAKQGETETAYRDLEEALDYAVTGNYRIYEIDIRVGLAWAHLNTNNFQAAQAEAEKAKQMSTKIAYYWGEVDSTEVLTMICNSTKK